MRFHVSFAEIHLPVSEKIFCSKRSDRESHKEMLPEKTTNGWGGSSLWDFRTALNYLNANKPVERWAGTDEITK